MWNLSKKMYDWKWTDWNKINRKILDGNKNNRQKEYKKANCKSINFQLLNKTKKSTTHKDVLTEITRPKQSILQCKPMQWMLPSLFYLKKDSIYNNCNLSQQQFRLKELFSIMSLLFQGIIFTAATTDSTGQLSVKVCTTLPSLQRAA